MTKKVHCISGSDADFRSWFEHMYQEHFERLYRYAFSITKNMAHAEDVVSEVFLNIWNNQPDYQNIQELNSYLHVSVKHLAIRQVSKDPGRFSYSTYDETLQITDSIDPEDLLLGKELKELVNEIISELPPHAQLVYDLSKNRGMNSQEIAEELGIAKRTVESHLYAVLKKMKTTLGRHFQGAAERYPYFTKISTISALIVGALISLL